LGTYSYYDPVPLADDGGQERFSPYAAMGNNPAMMVDPGGMQVGEMQVVPPHTLFKFFMPFSTFAMSRGKIDNDIKDVLAARQAALDYFKANAQAWAVILTGLYSSSGIVCNFGAGGGGDSGNDVGEQNSSTNPDKPDGTMTLSQANKWAHIGNGEGVYIDFTKMELPKTVTMDRFNKSDLNIDGNKAILVKFDGADFVNPNQALVYGTITLVLIGNNTVGAMPDVYDFDIKNKSGTLWRDIGTMGGAYWSNLGYTTMGQGFPIYFHGYQQIPDK